MPPQLPYERLIRFHMVWETVENTTRIPLAHVVGNLNSDSLSGLTTFKCVPLRGLGEVMVNETARCVRCPTSFDTKGVQLCLR
ncbi:hypothetical protein TNCV_4809281 [Trichonephila clavipes]|nr:hypothetical protein TNCV_4809281 [Trichonephila clavipes]